MKFTIKSARKYQELLQKAEICKHADHDKSWYILPDSVKQKTQTCNNITLRDNWYIITQNQYTAPQKYCPYLLEYNPVNFWDLKISWILYFNFLFHYGTIFELGTNGTLKIIECKNKMCLRIHINIRFYCKLSSIPRKDKMWIHWHN